MKCGECLMSRVEFVELRADGTCPKCYPDPVKTAPRDFVCGTRRVKTRGPSDFRVVCATCEAGGSVRHATRQSATSAAVRDSARACAACGAS